MGRRSAPHTWVPTSLHVAQQTDLSRGLLPAANVVAMTLPRVIPHAQSSICEERAPSMGDFLRAQFLLPPMLPNGNCAAMLGAAV